MALTMIVVGTFQTSARLGEAYGKMASYCWVCCLFMLIMLSAQPALVCASVQYTLLVTTCCWSCNLCIYVKKQQTHEAGYMPCLSLAILNLQRGCYTGLAVVWDMLLTTQFLTLVMLTVWRLPTPVAICFHLFFSAIEATFFSACAEKVPTGKHTPADRQILHNGDAALQPKIQT